MPGPTGSTRASIWCHLGMFCFHTKKQLGQGKERREFYQQPSPYHPWDDCIFTYMNGWFLWDQLVGKYTVRSMDGMGRVGAVGIHRLSRVMTGWEIRRWWQPEIRLTKPVEVGVVYPIICGIKHHHPQVFGLGYHGVLSSDFWPYMVGLQLTPTSADQNGHQFSWVFPPDRLPGRVFLF